MVFFCGQRSTFYTAIDDDEYCTLLSCVVVLKPSSIAPHTTPSIRYHVLAAQVFRDKYAFIILS